MKSSWLSSLRGRLALWLLKKGVTVEIEARHGAARTRSRQCWIGQLLRVDIPVQQRHGVVDFGPKVQLTTQEIEAAIDKVTMTEGIEPSVPPPGGYKIPPLTNKKKIT